MMIFQHPLKPTRILTQKCHSGHIANDWGGRTTPIYAAQSGRVVKVVNKYDVNQVDKSLGYANQIKIDHGIDGKGDGWVTLYAHIHPHTLVQVGDIVTIGQLIGYTDNNGNTDGDHLHFEIRKNNVKVCPEKYLFEEVQPPTNPLPEFPDLGTIPQFKTLTSLNVRVRPKYGTRILWTMKPNALIYGLNSITYQSGDIWVMLNEGVWSAYRFNGQRLMEYLPPGN